MENHFIAELNFIIFKKVNHQRIKKAIAEQYLLFKMINIYSLLRSTATS